MTVALLLALFGFLYGVLIGSISHWFRRDWRRSVSEGGFAWLTFSFGAAVGAAVAAEWIRLPVDAVTGLIGAWLWLYFRPRQRKRSPRLAGAKSRALVAALVRRAREAARPRPVLRPQPGGAR